MQIPASLVQSLEGIPGFNREAFLQVHSSGEQVTSLRINRVKSFIATEHFSKDNLIAEVPWSDTGRYLQSRPSFTFDPFFHAGAYYVQEASSMFIEQAFKQALDLNSSIRVLDLCAAPGGKSTHIQSLISKDSLLVSNEIIRSRALVLKDNIIKWGCENVIVTNNDPADFSKATGYFDAMMIDAPCSGSGLFRREPEAIDEWSENNVALCHQRQQRILADAWPALKEDGLLIYSTCSYSVEEDENIVDWIERELGAEPIPLSIPAEWNITEVRTSNGNTGYRFWPDKIKGEGFFIACFRKTSSSNQLSRRNGNTAEQVSKSEAAFVNDWVAPQDHRYIKYKNTVYAWRENFVDDYNFILDNFRTLYSGTLVGELMRNKLVPDHALAMSAIINPEMRSVSLDLEQAIRFLQRKDIEINIASKGWQLVNYEGKSLGWINVLQNRINNYYPKELRILRDK